MAHNILLVLILFLKRFGLYLEKSTRHFKTEKNYCYSCDHLSSVIYGQDVRLAINGSRVYFLAVTLGKSFKPVSVVTKQYHLVPDKTLGKVTVDLALHWPLAVHHRLRCEVVID